MDWGAPIWFAALLLAALAPFAVRALQAALTRRMRERTLDVIHRAGLSPRPDEGASGRARARDQDIAGRDREGA